MRVVIDARKLDDFGIGSYLRNLVRGVAGLRPDWSFSLIGAPGSASSVQGSELAAIANVEWLDNRASGYGLTELFSIARQADRAGADVFHSPHYVFPFRLRCAGVVTIHDCIHLRFPEQLPRPLGVLPRALSRAYATRMMRHATTATAAVIAVSEATKRDLVALVGAAPDDVHVIPNGCDEYFLEAPTAADLTRATRALSLPRRFVLYAGNAKPHKNLDRLLSAFDRLHARSPELGMVVVGAVGRATARELGARSGVRFLGRVTREQLRALYHRAAVFAFPSLYEGFGLPPLEAMACGTPTVVSDRAALPEVTADGALHVDPTDVAAIERAIRDLLEDEALARAVAARGKARAVTFSWARAAEATVRIYERAAGATSTSNDREAAPGNAEA